MRTLAVTAALAIVLAAAAPAARAQGAGEAITLKPRYEQGERWAYEDGLTRAMKVKTTVDGQLVQNLDNEEGNLDRGVVTILETDGENLNAVRVEFAPECGETARSNQAAEPVVRKRPYAGKTVTIKRSPTGEVTHDLAGPVSDDDRDKLEEIVKPKRFYYPKGPIKVGDKWAVDPKVLAEGMKLPSEISATMACDLRGVKEVDGRKAADVGVVFKAAGKQGGLDMTMELSGSILIEVACGLEVQSDMSGPITLSGGMDQPDETGKPRKIEVAGTGTLSGHGSAHRVKGGGIGGVIGSGSTPSGEPITIARKFMPGERWATEYALDTKMTVKVLVNGQLTRTGEETSRRLDKTDSTVVAAEGDQLSVMKVAYDAENGETKMSTPPAPGTPRTRKRPYAGKTVTIKRDPAGEVSHDFVGTLEPEDLKQLKNAVNPKTFHYPKAPVRVGERWTVDPKDVAKQLDLQPDDRATMTCELKGLKVVDGMKAAEVAVAITVNGMKEGMDIRMEMAGTLLIDLASGREIGADLSGPVKLSGVKEQPGANGQTMKIEILGEGTMTIAEKARPVKGGGEAAPGGEPGRKGF